MDNNLLKMPSTTIAMTATNSIIETVKSSGGEPSANLCGVADEMMTCYEFIVLADPEQNLAKEQESTRAMDEKKRAQDLLTMKHRLGHKPQQDKQVVTELDMCVEFCTCQDPAQSLGEFSKSDPPTPDAPSVAATALSGDGSIVSPILIDKFEDANNDDPPGTNRERGGDAPSIPGYRSKASHQGTSSHRLRYHDNYNEPERHRRRHSSSNNRRRSSTSSSNSQQRSLVDSHTQSDDEDLTLSPEEAEPLVDIDDTSDSRDPRSRHRSHYNYSSSMYNQNLLVAERTRVARAEAEVGRPDRSKEYGISSKIRERSAYDEDSNHERRNRKSRSSSRENKTTRPQYRSHSDFHEERRHNSLDHGLKHTPTTSIYNHNPVVAAHSARKYIESRHDKSPQRSGTKKTKSKPTRDSDTVQACAGGPHSKKGSRNEDSSNSDVDTDRSSMTNKVMIVVVVRIFMLLCLLSLERFEPRDFPVSNTSLLLTTFSSDGHWTDEGTTARRHVIKVLM